MTQINPCRGGAKGVDRNRVTMGPGRQCQATGKPCVTLPAVDTHQADKQGQAIAQKGEQSQGDDEERHK